MTKEDRFAYVQKADALMRALIARAEEQGKTAIYVSNSYLDRALPEIPKYSGESLFNHLIVSGDQAVSGWHTQPDVNAIVGFSLIKWPASENVLAYAENKAVAKELGLL